MVDLALTGYKLIVKVCTVIFDIEMTAVELLFLNDLGRLVH